MDKFELNKEGDQWKLKREGAEKATAAYGDANKQEAIRLAAERLKAQANAASLKIRKVNGQFDEERTYPRAADPKKSPG